MAKKYTQAQWARLQARFPKEDRVPYSDSPDAPKKGPAEVRAANEKTTTPTVTQPTQSDERVLLQKEGVIPTPVVTSSEPEPGPKPVTETGRVDNGDGTFTVSYSDGSTKIVGTKTTKSIQQLPSGFTAGPFPAELQKLFGTPGDILGYRINTEKDEDGNTYYTLSVANRGAYGEGVTGYSTFGARFTRDAGGNYVSYTSSNKKTKTNNTSLDSGNTTNALLEYQKQQDAAATKASRESAFDILKAEFTKYGLGSLVDTVKNLILDGVSKEEVTMKLRETQAYQTRFSGNKGRLDAGLNVYDESTYLELENQYDLALSSYGVLDAAGSTTAARQAKYGEWIAGTKSPNEIKGRVQLAVAAQAEDEVTKATLRQFYPMISDTDIISYFLNPKDTLPKLETKVRASQIGAAAVRQGLVTNVTTAEELAAFDITEEQAQRGYSAYAGMKQDIDKLTGIDRVTFGQAEAEGALLKGLASEQRKLEGLREREMARYKGASGVSKVALGDAAKGTF